MTADMQPLFWRISRTDEQGIGAVSLLMPASENENPAVFPTDVNFLSQKLTHDPRDIRWSDEDSDLFLSLLDRIIDVENETNIELDLNDNVVQGLVQLVALHRFQTPRPADELLGDDLITLREELEIGDLVSLNTQYGRPAAIIVGLDSIDVTCILLDPLNNENQELLVPEQTVLMVNRLAVLAAAFADSDCGHNAVLH